MAGRGPCLGLVSVLWPMCHTAWLPVPVAPRGPGKVVEFGTLAETCSLLATTSDGTEFFLSPRLGVLGPGCWAPHESEMTGSAAGPHSLPAGRQWLALLGRNPHHHVPEDHRTVTSRRGRAPGWLSGRRCTPRTRRSLLGPRACLPFALGGTQSGFAKRLHQRVFTPRLEDLPTVTLDSEPGWWGLAVPQRLGSACRAPLGGNALPCVWLGPALQWSTCAVAEFVCMLCAEL